jgi:endonuclease I
VPSLGTPAPAGATATWTVPLQVTVGVGAQLAAAPPPAPTASPPAAIAAAADPLVQAALVDLEANRAQPYYDEAKDGRDRDAYYRDVPAGAEPGALFAALSALVTGTHVRQPKYQPIKLVYPWVDLHPDRRIRSIYSGRAFSPEELIRADALVEALRTTRLQEVAFHEAAPGPEDMAAEIARFEESLPYNCEHSVPQSSFGAAEPMRGDLHHLFACESGCNSFRGNTPYFDFADFEEKIRHECGRREEGRFEPSSGKGAVARATLYFLLRYPGVVGDETRELQRDRLPTLLDWHRAHPVDDWERHRNMAIADVQGNRNPLIDHPEWAEHVDFALGLGKEIRR